MMTVTDLQDRKDLQLLTDSQDKQALMDYFPGIEDIEEYDTFFVKVEDGEYKEIYACYGTPYLQKRVYKLL